MRNLAKLKLAPSSVWRVAQRFKHRNFDADKVDQNRFERTRAKVLEIENVVQIIRKCYAFLEYNNLVSFVECNSILNSILTPRLSGGT